MTQLPEYRNVAATVRSPRCAVLINENSSYWEAAVTGTIRHASEVWGGRHFLIIPTDGTRIKDKFWELLQAYSPDHIVVYGLTFLELEEFESAKYTQIKENHRKSWIEGGYDEAGFEEYFTGSAETLDLDKLTISPELNQELLHRLTPFHNGGDIAGLITYKMGFGFPFTKVTDIISSTSRHIGQVVLPRRPSDSAAALLIYSQTGLGSAEYIRGLAEEHFVADYLPDNYDECDFLEDALGERSGLRVPSADRWHPTADYLPNTPFGLSLLHLGHYFTLTHQSWHEPIIVILGDGVEDFCLYYSLSRLHDRVFWLPLSWLRACASYHRSSSKEAAPASSSLEQRLGQTMVNMFRRLVNQSPGSDVRLELRSMSLTIPQLRAYKSQLSQCAYLSSDRFAKQIDCVAIEASSTTCIARVFEENNYASNTSVVFVDGVSVSPFPTPKPKNFTFVDPRVHRWVASLEIEGYQPPSVPSLATHVIQLRDSTHELRLAADGIVYQCPNLGYFGGDVDVNLVRPKLRMPDAMSMFNAYVGATGATVRYSDKGNYFLDTIRRFGSLAQTGQFIKAPTTRSILDKFVQAKPSVDDKGKRDGRVVFLDNDQRTYLSLEALVESMGDEDSAISLADELVGKTIMQRGYILHCDRCNLSSWYGLDVLAADFTCNRCSFRQQLTRRHWKHPKEPHWYYKLAETVYQFYRNNSHLTAQVLYKLEAESKHAFHYAPELQLIDFPTSGARGKELDVACILDGQIIIGECKTGDLPLKEIDKYETIARQLPRRPDRIVFALSQPVSDSVLGAIAGVRNSEIFTFDDLYDR